MKSNILQEKAKGVVKPSAILLRDLYAIINDKKASHSERKEALDQINKLAEPKPSEQKTIERKKIVEQINIFKNVETEKSNPLIIAEPKEPIYCLRCRTEIRFYGLCVKCGKLIDLFRNTTNALRDLKRGNYLVFFEGSGFWISQPKELAEHNEKLGKDVFKGEFGKWCPIDVQQKFRGR